MRRNSIHISKKQYALKLTQLISAKAGGVLNVVGIHPNIAEYACGKKKAGTRWAPSAGYAPGYFYTALV